MNNPVPAQEYSLRKYAKRHPVERVLVIEIQKRQLYSGQKEHWEKGYG